MSAGCSTAQVTVSPGQPVLTAAVTLADGVPAAGSVTLTYSTSHGVPATSHALRIAKYQVKYEGNDWSDIANSRHGGTAESSAVISGLIPNQIYNFQVRAVNQIGTGVPSASVMVMTAGHEASAHDLTVSSSHTDYYGNDKRVVFRAQPVYNTARNRHHNIKLAADDVFPHHAAYWIQSGNRVPSAAAGIEVELSDTFAVAVRLKLSSDADYSTAGPQLSDPAVANLRVVIGEGDEYLGINLRQVESNPTEPYTGTVADPVFRALITRFFDRTNREGSNPFWIAVIDSRKEPAAQTPTPHPTMSYSATRPSRGDSVTGTLSSTADLNQFLDGPYYVWQARRTYGYGDTWEFTIHHGRTLVIPDDAEIGSEWRLCWMRHNLIEFPTTHILVREGDAPTCTYSNTTPDRGDDVTATLSYGGASITEFLWQQQTAGGSTWAFITDATDAAFTVPSDAAHGTKFRFTWRRQIYDEAPDVGFVRRREYAPTHVTVMRAGYGVPTVVRNLRATALANEIRLNWDEPDTAGDGSISYRVRQGGITVTVTERTYTFINLSNGTEYLFSVWPVNDAGEGPAAQIAQTPGSVPFRPTNVRVAFADNRLTLRWHAADGNGHAVTGYEVRIDSGDPITVPDHQLGYIFRGLVNGTTYALQVRALNDLGHSPWTTSVNGRPAPGSTNVENDGGALVIDDITHIPAHGNYTLADTYDLGAVYIVRAAVYMDAGAENTNTGATNFDAEPGLFDAALGLFDGLTQLTEFDGIDAHAEVRHKDALADAWSAWAPLTIAYIQARYFECRILLTTYIANLRPRVRVFRFRLSLPPRTESGSVTTSNVDVVVSYAKHFHAAPNLVVTCPTLQTDEVVVITSESTAEFHIRVQRQNGTRQNRLVHWVATGYGEQVE